MTTPTNPPLEPEPQAFDHAALMVKARRVVNTLRRRIDAAAKTQDGPWLSDWDSCDCNDGMCSHGSWIAGVLFPNPVTEPFNGEPVKPGDWHHQASTELPTEVSEYLLLWQLPTGRAVLAALERLLDRYNALAVQDRHTIGDVLGWDTITALVDSLHDSRTTADRYSYGPYGENDEIDPEDEARFAEHVAESLDDPSQTAEAARIRAAAAAHLAAVRAGGAA